MEDVEICRNAEWKNLDFAIVERACGDVTRYEYVMCMNQCEDEEMCIKAIFNKRKSDEDYAIFLHQFYTQVAAERFIRSHYNDLEDDIEEHYY